jgi:diphthamide synthase (EF-2-diphthine--ammonia ligase)
VLITTVTADHERISMHGVRRDLLLRQARAIDLPLVEVEIPGRKADACVRGHASALDRV